MKDSRVTISKVDFKPIENPFDEDLNFYKLNMPVWNAFKAFQVNNIIDFEEALIKNGVKRPFTFIASEEDVEDYQRLDSLFPEFGDYKGKEDEKEFNHAVLFFLHYMTYRDLPYGTDGKLGLKCTSGKIVVPPLFEACGGAEHINFNDVMCSVQKDGKMWLTPRDGSGNLIAGPYDNISRSIYYAWVENNNKRGLLDSKTGEVLVPCEMDWIASSESSGSWFIGKDDKIGIISAGYGHFKTTYAFPEYELINLTTGQFLKVWQWGWVLKDGNFSLTPPNPKVDSYFYVQPYFPLSDKYLCKYYDLVKYIKIKEIGISHRYENRSRDPRKRLILPTIKAEDIKCEIFPQIEVIFKEQEKFHSKFDDRGSGATIEDPNGAQFNVIITSGKSMGIKHKYFVGITWIEDNIDRIAVDEAFPLSMACRRYITHENGKTKITYDRDFEGDDFILPMKFLSAMMKWRSLCASYDYKTRKIKSTSVI